MRDEKRVVTRNGFEQRLMVAGLTDFRNDALRDGKPGVLAAGKVITQNVTAVIAVRAGGGVVDPRRKAVICAGVVKIAHP